MNSAEYAIDSFISYIDNEKERVTRLFERKLSMLDSLSRAMQRVLLSSEILKLAFKENDIELREFYDVGMTLDEFGWESPHLDFMLYIPETTYSTEITVKILMENWCPTGVLEFSYWNHSDVGLSTPTFYVLDDVEKFIEQAKANIAEEIRLDEIYFYR
jgi:hypothetical protein